MTAHLDADPAGLGRGALTRWMPVLGRAPQDPPPVQPFAVTARTTPRGFLLRVVFSATRLSLPATVLAVLWQVGEAFVPIIAGLAIDDALTGLDGGRLLLWLAVLGVDVLVLSFAFRFSSQLTARAVEEVQHRLRATLSRTVLHPAGGGPARHPDGSVVSTMTNDVTRLAAVGLTVYPVAEFAAIVFIGVSLLVLHWPLGLAALAGAPVAVWAMLRFSGRLADDTRRYQELLAGTVGQATDLVSGYRVVRGLGAEAEAARRYREASRRTLAGARRNMRLLGGFLVGSTIVSGLFVTGVAGLACWYALTGELSLGGLIAAVGLAQALLPPMQMLAANAVPTWATAVASSGRVVDALREHGAEIEPETETASDRTTAPGEDTAAPVPAVAFTLPSGRTVTVAPGELVGVRADDRTAAALAAALLSPSGDDTADVRIDGVPAARWADGHYRSRVTVSPHHAVLFRGTVDEILDVPSAPAHLRAPAMHAAARDDFVANARGGTAHAGERGGRFSGGQRQRLMLARALASDAPVLVLHDPTTAIDSVTEAVIAPRLRAMRRDRSTILIASSPALLAVCDRVEDAGGKGGGRPWPM